MTEPLNVRMRAASFLCLFALMSSCVPVVEFERPVKETRAPMRTEQAPLRPVEAPQVVTGTALGINFEGVTFDARSHRLMVVSQASGPGSTFADAAAACQSVGGLAAVNGGFFTPEGRPLGLVIANGEREGVWNSASSLGGGIWHANAGGSAITRRDKLGRSAAAGMRDLLQAGPMLVEHGRAVMGLDEHKASARTIILWDGGNRWWVGRGSPATLAQTAAALAQGQVPGWRVRHALNLDGGRSSELWVSPSVPGGPLTRRPPWNRPVLNYLVLVPASS